MDGFTWFENVGDLTEPAFATGQRLSPRMDLQMITPVAVDWDGDGAIDLVCGDEDGRVALIRNQRLDDGEKGHSATDRFASPVYFQQEAADVKFGALVTPVSVDWDDDGDEDLVCGNTAGYIGLIENLDGGVAPQWSQPLRLQYASSRDDTLRYQADVKGSIQGPCEAKWGYTTLSIEDWDHDGLADLVVNGIWGRVNWHRREQQRVSFPQSVGIDSAESWSVPAWSWWNPEPGELATQWRTTPCVLDWNTDKLNDLVMLDHEGYLAFYEREKRGEELILLPPQRIFKIEGPCEFDSRHRPVGDEQDGLLRLNANRAGASGRRKLHFVDWDGDGRLDLLVNSVNVNFLRNVRTDEEGFTWFRDEGPLDERVLAGHTTSPTTVDWDKNGIPDLLVGAEDGFLYYKENPRAVVEN
jgi:hypothetical protein